MRTGCSYCMMPAALELLLVDVVRLYLSLLAIVCQMQSCWTRWRTLGRCHRRCQIWTHLQDKHANVYLLHPASVDSVQNVSMHQFKFIQCVTDVSKVSRDTLRAAH